MASFIHCVEVTRVAHTRWIQPMQHSKLSDQCYTGGGEVSVGLDWWPGIKGSVSAVAVVCHCYA